VTIRPVVRLVAVTAALLLFGMTTGASAAPRGAATVNVKIENFTFLPGEIEVDKGDIVRWTNFDTAIHSPVTIHRGFVTTTLGFQQSFQLVTDRSGTFNYVCAIHGASMQGRIVVRGIPEPFPPETPNPDAIHVEDVLFKPARPDFPLGLPTDTPPVLAYGAAGLIVIAVARFGWAIRPR
jgi:plastocyanin